MKKLIAFLLAFGMSINAYALPKKYEGYNSDAQSSVAYGYNGSTLVPIQVDSSGKLVTSGSGGGTNIYEGLVANNLKQNNHETANTEEMSRSPHIAKDNISFVKVGFPNWFQQNTSNPEPEAGTGGSITITASIEYPAGTFTQLTFNNSTSGTIANNSTLFSDYVPVTIPINSTFYVRAYLTGASGLPYFIESSQNWSGQGAGLEAGMSGITDKTLSGTVSSNSTYYTPVAIVGYTSKPSFIILGDSITAGFGDVTTDATLDSGPGARYVGGNYAYINFGSDSDKANNFNTGVSTQRQAMFKYASYLLCDYGRNDIDSLGVDQQGLLISLRKIWNIAFGNKMYVLQGTLGPTTTSTDNWATVGNQTVGGSSWNSTKDGYRIAFNDALRINTATYGITGYFDYALGIESGLDSGFWTVTGGATTTDGIHPNSHGCKLVRDTSGLISTPINTCSIANCPLGSASPTTSGGGSGTISSGTVNQEAVYTGTTTLGSGLIYDDGTNIGIGTSAPVKYFDISSAPGTSGSTVLMLDNQNGKKYEMASLGSASALNPNSLLIQDNTAVANRILLDSNGNVGIGSITPGQILDVQGTVRATHFVGDGSGITGIGGSISGLTTNKLSKAASSTTIADSQFYDNGTNIGIGTTAPQKYFEIAQAPGTSGSTVFGLNNNNGHYWEIASLGSASAVKANSLLIQDFTASANRLLIDSGGNVGIGSINPTQLLDVAGSIRQSTEKSCSTGLTTDATGTINGCVASDESLKINIVNLPYNPNLIMKLNPVTYNWKDNRDQMKVHNGFIAQQVAQSIPGAVIPAGGTYRGVDPNAVLSVVVKEEQHQRLELDNYRKIFLGLFLLLITLGFYLRVR